MLSAQSWVPWVYEVYNDIHVCESVYMHVSVYMCGRVCVFTYLWLHLSFHFFRNGAVLNKLVNGDF